jgi:DUF177 domain-containing protein
MFIDINTIGSEGLSFARSVRLHGLEGPSRESIPDIDARLEGTVIPNPGGAELSAHLGASVPLTCSRCLETFPWDVRTEFAWKVLRHAPDPVSPAGRGRVDDEASVLLAPEGKIGLEDLATEQLYLNLPLKPICSPSCKGLCPTCGTNRNLGGCGCEPDDAERALAPLLPFRRKLQDF